MLLLVVVRVVATTALVIALYFLLPLDHVGTSHIGITLTVAALLLAVAASYEIWSVVRAPYPAIRAIEAVATFISVYVILFASSYYLMQLADPTSFTSNPLTRTDALYYTVTVLSTVGFGDITASSEQARIAVTLQMTLNLVILGLGIRVLTRAVQLGRDYKARGQDEKP
jgi:hypothetical protein